MYQNEKSIGTYFIHVTFAGGLIYILPKTVTLVFLQLNNALINFIGEVGIDVSRIEDSFQSAWGLIMEENILRIMFLILIIALFAISIHGRTVRQGFSGDVDYELIKKVKEKVKIPVIVSGDIDSPLKAKEILDYTGCDGIMIGRAVKGRLWLMMNMLIFIIGNGGRVIDAEFNPDIDWKKEFSKIYLKFLINFKGENKAVREFRKHLCWIFKGTRGISRARSEFFKIESFKDAINCINNI